MVSCETYYRRAFAAARAHGRYVGGGLYASTSGELRRVRLYEEWIEDPSRGFLVLV